LPDCLAARLPGTLVEVEAVVRALERAPSVEGACTNLRLEIELPGVLRWVRRRVRAVHAALGVLKGLLPALFAGCEPTLAAFAEWLGTDTVLPALRPIAAPYLCSLPAPFGFAPRQAHGGEADRARQHAAGPDPPAASR
jgi:hypothetical protein